MKIFGNEIQVKKEICSFNKTPGKTLEKPHINLYVRLTNFCQASCDFCKFSSKESSKFDFFKFYYMIFELSKQIKINKVSFTGGEPTAFPDLLNRCLKAVKDVDKNIFTVVNTNGLKIDEIDLCLVDSISLSRHSIFENDKIFKCTMEKNLNSFTDLLKSKVHISCNLIKGFVDSSEKVYEFINHFSSIGFHDFGFVSLMKVNDYCRKNFVDFSDINLETMKNTIKTKTFEYQDKCKCNNFLTSDSSGIINKVYARHYCDSSNSDSTLVYDLNVLKNGFDGSEIQLLRGGD